jgi:hypothetical protein
MTDDSVILRRGEARLTANGPDQILEHPAEQIFFRLNPTGQQIWALLARFVSFGELCDQLVAEFEVSRAEIDWCGIYWQKSD